MKGFHLQNYQMREEILKLINNSLLLNIPTKKKLRSTLETLSQGQMKKLLEILKAEKKYLKKILTEALKNPAKKDAYNIFIKSLSKGLREAFIDKEKLVDKEEEVILSNLELELKNI